MVTNRRETRDDLILSEPQLRDEVITADLTGTAASVTSSSGETDDDSANTLLFTVTDGSGEAWDGVEQTVTYPANTDTALEKAAAINDQGKGIHADVSGSNVVIETDITGPGVTIAIGSGTATMVWGTPVAGTGDPATWPKGTLLARNSSTLKMNKYADSGANDTNNPRAVLPHDLTFSASGDLATQVLVGGKVNETKLSKLSDATAISKAVLDKLIMNSNIVPQTVRNTSVFDD